MIKAFLCILCLTFVLNTSSLFAEIGSNIEIRSAAFFPSSNRFKEIYGNCGASYQLDVSTNRMYCYGDLWGNFDWFSKKGKTDGFNDPTRINIATVSLGLKTSYQLCNQLQPYLGLGVSFSNVWLKNKTDEEDEKLSKLSVGGVLKTGIYYFINESVFMDLFFDYFYQPNNFKTHVDLGGLKTGLGLGVQF